MVLPRPNCSLRSGKTEVSRRKTLEWILVLGIAHLSIVAAVAADADLVEHQVRRRVVRVDDHQPDRVAQREARPPEKWYVSKPEPGTLSSFFRVTIDVEVDLPAAGLPVGFDHDGKLDQAGRRHRLVGVVRERFARCPDS